MPILMGVKWYLMVLLVSFSLMTNDVVHLGRIYALLSLGGVSIRSNWHMLLFKLSVHVNPVFVLSIIESMVLKSSNNVELSIWPFNSVSSCSMYFGVFMLAEFMLIIVIESLWIDPLTA